MSDSEGIDYEINSFYEHMVSRYTGLNMLEVESLDYLDYLAYRRDAFIYKMSQTEKGREYLNNAYRLEQTAPDRKSLRDQFGEEVKRG
jgi:hypothetical protein